MSDPSVSVLIPVYNGEHTLARCIDSVLAQKYPFLEVVVVNDCSTDGTAAVLERYAGRVKAVRNERNSGIAKTYNRALRASVGEIVLMLASDCALATPDYVERMVRHFDDARIGAVAGKAMIPAFAQAPSVERIFARLNILDVNDPDTGIHRVNFVEVRCDGFRRQVLEDIGGLNEDLFRSNEDQDLSIRIARTGYRLLQDNSLEFLLGFGGTEDSLPKLLSKQGQYARGQAYIAVNYGVGSNDGLWTNANRRRRAIHRMTQAAVLPALFLLGAVAAAQPAIAMAALLLFIAVRVVHFWRLTTGLRFGERLASLPLGLASDVIYSVAFNSGVVLWVMRGKSRLSTARRRPDSVAPRT
jgi:glycosyltransferase involved in cell wall biosynthesis